MVLTQSGGLETGKGTAERSKGAQSRSALTVSFGPRFCQNEQTTGHGSQAWQKEDSNHAGDNVTHTCRGVVGAACRLQRFLFLST
jgi:hypothetical protein